MKDTAFNITLDNLSGAMMLTIEPKEEMEINEFCCEMIKKTNVYGLLKLNVTTIDGKVTFNYDLSKKKSMAEFSKAGFNESYGRRILYNLCNTFLKLNEYYLKPSFCLLDPNYTYIGDGLNVYLPYIPVKYAKTDSDELKNYFSELLSNFFAVEGVSAYDEMFKYVYQCQTLDLSHFVSKFLMSEERSSNNFVPMNNGQMNQQPNSNIPNAMPMNNVPLKNQQRPMQNQAAQMNMQRVNMPQANMPSPNNVKPQSGNGFKLPNIGGIKLPMGKKKDNIPNPQGNLPNMPSMPGGAPKVPGGGFKMPGANIPGNVLNMPGGAPKVPGGGGFKMPGANMQGAAPNMPGGAPKVPGGGFKMPGTNMQGVAPNMQSNVPKMPNIPNQNQMPRPQFMNNNQPPMQGRMQGGMDKTIMMDGAMQQQMPAQNSGVGMAYLRYNGQNIPISDSEFVIGKANNQYKINFAISNNPHVSRKHATILMQGNSYFIRDEGSTNGTYVNGRSIPKMMPQPLKNGDEISIYDEVFIFCS